MPSNEYLLLVSHGDYDDHVRVPLLITHELDTASMLQLMIEERDVEVIEKYCPQFWEIIPKHSVAEFSIDIERLPVVNI